MLKIIDKEFSKQLLTRLYKQTELLKNVSISEDGFDLDNKTVKVNDTLIPIEVVGKWRKQVFEISLEELKQKYSISDEINCSEIYVDKIGILTLSCTKHNTYYILENDGYIVLVAFQLDYEVSLPLPRIPLFISKCIHQYEFDHKDSVILFLESYNISYTMQDNTLVVSYPVEIPKFLFRKAKTIYRDITIEFEDQSIKNLYVEQRKNQ